MRPETLKSFVPEPPSERASDLNQSGPFRTMPGRLASVSRLLTMVGQSHNPLTLVRGPPLRGLGRRPEMALICAEASPQM